MPNESINQLCSIWPRKSRRVDLHVVVVAKQVMQVVVLGELAAEAVLSNGLLLPHDRLAHVRTRLNKHKEAFDVQLMDSFGRRHDCEKLT